MASRKKRRPSYAARLDEGVLVVAHDANLPAVCLKCGSHDRITKRPTTFYWSPLWARLLMFCGVGLLLALFMREEAELNVPLCPACIARWTAARHATYLAGAVAVGAVVLLRVTRTKAPLAGLATIALVAAVVALVVRFNRPRTLQVKKIDPAEEEIHLNGFDAAAADEIVAGSK